MELLVDLVPYWWVLPVLGAVIYLQWIHPKIKNSFRHQHNKSKRDNKKWKQRRTGEITRDMISKREVFEQAQRWNYGKNFKEFLLQNPQFTGLPQHQAQAAFDKAQANDRAVHYAKLQQERTEALVKLEEEFLRDQAAIEQKKLDYREKKPERKAAEKERKAQEQQKKAQELHKKRQEAAQKKSEMKAKREIDRRRDEASKKFLEVITIKNNKTMKNPFNRGREQDPPKTVGGETALPPPETANVTEQAKQYCHTDFMSAPFGPALKACTYKVERYPKILLATDVYFDMRKYIGIVKENEVGFLGTVRQFEQNVEHLIIEEIFLVRQQVTPTFCSLKGMTISVFLNELAQTPEGEDKVDRMRFHGHKHPGGVEPSSDDQTLLKKQSANVPYYVRGIFNNKGDVNFTVVSNPFGLTFEHVPWDFYDPRLSEQSLKATAEEVNEKLSPLTHRPVYASPGASNPQARTQIYINDY